MRILGLIVEYNPFHFGHLYHVEAAQRLCQPDLTVAIMSGHFTQRGDVSIVNKWARAEMALYSGVDAVFELPLAWALRSAADFAMGGVHHLHQLGVTHLCFGSETDDLDGLAEIAQVVADEPEAYRHELLSRLGAGQAYPRARAGALDKVLGTKVEKPNDILGLEYMVALRRLNSSITPLTVLRKGAGYHDESLSSPLASATAIRRGLFAKHVPHSLPLPLTSQEIIARELEAGRGPVNLESFTDIIRHRVRTMSVEELGQMVDMEQGLPYRFKDVVRRCTDLPEIMRALKTKRYTWTRLQRILCYILLGLTRDKLASIHATGPSYLRLLALRTSKSNMLKELKSNIPIISSPARMKTNAGLNLDTLGTDLYVLGYPDTTQSRGGQDFLHRPILLE